MTISSTQRNTLQQSACAARANAYAPYSNYTVGAALLLADGSIVTGVNVENASYGLTNCAERSAIFTMVGNGKQAIDAIAVCTENGGSPCGACRQVLSEFAGDVPVYLGDAAGQWRETTVHTLLPDHFTPDHLSSS